MKLTHHARRRHARIEIVPLIDIVFFLLATFVMVSLSMIKNQGIPVNLPVAATATPQDRKFFTTLTVTEEGYLFIDKEKIALEELAPRIKSLKEADADLKVFIHGDEKASFGAAIQVLDEVRKQGIAKVAIQTTTAVASPAAASDSSVKGETKS